MTLRTALAGVLLSAVLQSACIGDGIDGDVGDPSPTAPGPSGTKPDLYIAGAIPPGGAAAGKVSPPKGSGGARSAEADTTQPPAPQQACAEAGAPCAGGICAVAADGQLACKLADRAVCAADDQCASGSCGSIVVPPDPSDPYDLGYTYVGCK
jgi:hypothetical protein